MRITRPISPPFSLTYVEVGEEMRWGGEGNEIRRLVRYHLRCSFILHLIVGSVTKPEVCMALGIGVCGGARQVVCSTKTLELGE